MEKMYFIQHKIATKAKKTINYMFKPVYLCIDNSFQDSEKAISDFIIRYYKHMYNIDFSHTADLYDKSYVYVKRVKFDKYKVDFYIYNDHKRTIQTACGNDKLESLPPVMYNQEYGELRIDIVKWFIDTKLLDKPYSMPAKELSEYECKALANIFNSLSIKEQYVIIYRYFRNKDFTINTHEEIANVLKVSRSRVQQIEKKAIKKLKHPYRLKRLLYIFDSKKQEYDDEYIKIMTSHNEIYFTYSGADKPFEYFKSIDDLDLSVRAYNCLRRHGIETISDLSTMSKQDILKIHNLGKKGFNEIIRKLESHNIRLSDDTYDYNSINKLNYDAVSFKKFLKDMCRILENQDEATFTVKKIKPEENNYTKFNGFFDFSVKIDDVFNHIFIDEDITTKDVFNIFDNDCEDYDDFGDDFDDDCDDFDEDDFGDDFDLDCLDDTDEE